MYIHTFFWFLLHLFYRGLSLLGQDLGDYWTELVVSTQQTQKCRLASPCNWCRLRSEAAANRKPCFSSEVLPFMKSSWETEQPSTCSVSCPKLEDRNGWKWNNSLPTSWEPYGTLGFLWKVVPPACLQRTPMGLSWIVHIFFTPWWFDPIAAFGSDSNRLARKS